MKLIDKDSLIEHMRKAYKGNTQAGFKWDLVSAVAVIGAEEEITPDAEPIRHGHWLSYEYGDYHWHKCSVCGVADKYIETVHRDGYPDKDVECIRHYCPNCGAKMEEDRKSVV